MLSPFDPKAALLAKHAQHVVLIHFPIALYLAGTCFDFCARFFRKTHLANAACWNFLAAAVKSLPAAATGVLAWRFALEGQAWKGVLRLHLILGWGVVAGVWLTVWLRRAQSQEGEMSVSASMLILETAVSLLIAARAHLGGFLSGVNV